MNFDSLSSGHGSSDWRRTDYTEMNHSWQSSNSGRDNHPGYRALLATAEKVIRLSLLYSVIDSARLYLAEQMYYAKLAAPGLYRGYCGEQAQGCYSLCLGNRTEFTALKHDRDA